MCGCCCGFFIRDLSPRDEGPCQQQGKEIDFELKGEDTELDKKIIDELKDPIMHLLRNAVDHGIEAPASGPLPEKRRPGR